MKIKLLVDGGDMKPGPAIGQQLGPLGVNIGNVVSEVNKSTENFKGMKVPVELDINTTTKKFNINIFSPPASELLKKELGAEKGSSLPNKTKIGNLAIEQIIKVAQIKYPNMIVSSFKAAVKTIVGSCVSLGILIDNKDPKEVQQEIDRKHYDKEISEQIIEISEEKKLKLDKFFEKVKQRQEKIAVAEEAAKAAAEAAKAAAGTPTEAAEAAKAETKPTEEVEEKK